MKKSKKFVLAGLVLLAITMVLLPLAGCKNDTVPEPTRYTVKFDKNAEDASGEMQSQIFTEGVEQELSANQFKRDTYTFNGWSEGKAATAPTYKDKAKFKATKDTTLYAVWTDNGTVTPVNFSPASSDTLYYGDTVTLSTTTEGATIQYHLGDGSWKDYDAGGKIQVTTSTTSTTITARAAKDGLKPSAVTSATYTVRKLEGITVTPPARTVYSVGEEVVHKKDDEIRATATYDDGTTRTVTGTITTDTRTLTQSAGIGKKVTVSYSEGGSPVTKDFTVDVVNVEAPTKLTSYSSPNNTGNDCTYIAFGEWPQSEALGVSPTLVDPQPENLFKGKYYSDANGEYVEKDGKYYKVEPIVWRVLNKDYASTGKALLLAESILTGGVRYYVSIDTREITKEKETEKVTVYTNNWQYSTVRAWLNGRYESDDPQANEYAGKGFLQTAFTESAQKLIADTSVDNSAASTIPSEITAEALKSDWNDGVNPYASDTPTTDKIFLLSEKEATNSEYGFAAYDAYGKGSTRIRVTTDYAEATRVYQDSTEGYGGWWWLRSPLYDLESDARGIDSGGFAYYLNSVNNVNGGVVPALSISLQ